MGNTSIEWTDKVWNPVRGCDPVSPGCKNCYAEKQAGRFCGPGQPFEGYVQIGKNGRPSPRWTGKVGLIEKHLHDPLKWRKPQRIFVNSMSDLFHERLPDAAIDRVFAVMALCPQQTFQVLTKRPKRMLRYFGGPANYVMVRRAAQVINKAACVPFWPLPNVWLGVSVEDQQRADERIPLLLRTPAAKRFVSYEPALGPVDFEAVPQCMDDFFPTDSQMDISNPMAMHYIRHGAPGIDWIIVGGESGPGARPFDIRWARNTIEQCRAAGVACFVKQMGGNLSDRDLDECQRATGKAVKDRKGGDMSEWPEDLRVREFPR